MNTTLKAFGQVCYFEPTTNNSRIPLARPCIHPPGSNISHHKVDHSRLLLCADCNNRFVISESWILRYLTHITSSYNFMNLISYFQSFHDVIAFFLHNGKPGPRCRLPLVHNQCGILVLRVRSFFSFLEVFSRGIRDTRDPLFYFWRRFHSNKAA